VAVIKLQDQLARDRIQIEYQFELQKFAATKEWDLQKKRKSSEIDFEFEEKKRLKKRQEYTSKLEQIDKSDMFTDGQKKAAKQAVELEYLDISDVYEKMSDPMFQAGQQMMGGQSPASDTPASEQFLYGDKPGVQRFTQPTDVLTVPPDQAVMYANQGYVASGQDAKGNILMSPPKPGSPLTQPKPSQGPAEEAGLQESIPYSRAYEPYMQAAKPGAKPETPEEKQERMQKIVDAKLVYAESVAGRAWHQRTLNENIFAYYLNKAGFQPRNLAQQ